MMGALRAYPFFAASSRNVGTTTVLFCASGLFCAAELRHTDSAARPEKSNRITVRIFIESPQGNDSALDGKTEPYLWAIRSRIADSRRSRLVLQSTPSGAEANSGRSAVRPLSSAR